MYSCPFTCRYRQTPHQEQDYETYLTPEGMFAEFTSKDLIAMLFLLTAFLTVESDCKDTLFFRYRMFLGDWCFFSWGDGDSFYLLCRFFCLSLHCILWL